MDHLEQAQQVLECLLGALLLLSAFNLLDTGLSAWLGRRLARPSAAARAKARELAEQRAELARIPMMDEFAKHMRKRRIVDRLEEELKKLSGS